MSQFATQVSVSQVPSLAMPESSRYKDTPLYLLPTGKLEFGLWNPDRTALDVAAFQTHQVTDYDVGRLDLMSYTYYGSPHYWWIIAYANRLLNPVRDMVPGMLLKIPPREVIDRYIQRRPTE